MDPGSWLCGFTYVLDGRFSWAWLPDKLRDAERPKKKIEAGWSPQRTAPAFPFLPVLRMALCIQGVDCQDDGRSKLEGDRGGIVRGQGSSFTQGS